VIVIWGAAEAVLGHEASLWLAGILQFKHLLVEGLDRPDADDIICDRLKALTQRRGLSLLEYYNRGRGLRPVPAVDRQENLA
jgi:hypothetical protein